MAPFLVAAQRPMLKARNLDSLATLLVILAVCKSNGQFRQLIKHPSNNITVEISRFLIQKWRSASASAKAVESA